MRTNQTANAGLERCSQQCLAATEQRIYDPAEKTLVGKLEIV